MPRKLENVDRYAILLHQEGKRRTAVLESKFYGRRGDPANHVEYESELRRQAKEKELKRSNRGAEKP